MKLSVSVLFRILLSLPILFGFPSLSAETWTPQGPEGGEISVLLPSPARAGVVFAGTVGGQVLISEDRGVTWSRFGNGLLAARVLDLAMPEIDEAPLFAATDRGLFRLASGEESWTALPTGFPSWQTLEALVFDPAKPKTCYGPVKFGTSGSWRLYRSDDAGISWTPISDMNRTQDLAVAPTTPTTLYSGAFGYVYRSQDGGETWGRSNQGLPLSNRPLDLTVAPWDANSVFATWELRGEDHGTVFKSTDGGISWSDTTGDLPRESFSPGHLVADPAQHGVLYYGGAQGVFRTSDRGTSWLPVNEAPGDQPIQALAVAPGDASVFAASSQSARPWTPGVLRTTDAGQTWLSSFSGIGGSFIRSLSPHPAVPGEVLASAQKQGLFRSEDGGNHWSPSGADFDGLSLGPLTRDPTSPATIFAVAGASPGHYTRLYGSTDGGRQWRVLGEDFSSRIGPVVLDPNRPGSLFLAHQGRIFQTKDPDAGWQDRSGHLCGRELNFVFHPTEEGTVLASCVEFAPDISPPQLVGRLLRSDNGGAQWQQTLKDNSPFNSDWKILFADSSTAYAYGRIFYSPGQSLLYRTTDGGLNWFALSNPPGNGLQAMVVNPLKANELLAGTARGGVFRSTDRGEHWLALNEGLSTSNVLDLVFDPFQPQRLLAGTEGGGAYAINLRDLPSCAGDQKDLCLLGRFRIEVEWQKTQSPSGPDQQGQGNSIPLSEGTGGFWFFREGNLELSVKIVDGRTANGHFWVFAGGLSTLQQTLIVTDTFSGAVRRYENAAGQLTSFGDTSAFQEAPAATSEAPSGGSLSSPKPPITTAADSTEILELQNGRFRLEVTWRTRDFRTTGQGTGIPLSKESGGFSFFRRDNIDLFVKILDGRQRNGHFWIFVASLSNVRYELTITDTETGLVGRTIKPFGEFEAFVDTQFF